MIASLLATRSEAAKPSTRLLKRARDDEPVLIWHTKVCAFEEYAGFRRDEFTECMVCGVTDWIHDDGDRETAKTLSGQYWRIGKLDNSLVFRQECLCHIYSRVYLCKLVGMQLEIAGSGCNTGRGNAFVYSKKKTK